MSETLQRVGVSETGENTPARTIDVPLPAGYVVGDRLRQFFGATLRARYSAEKQGRNAYWNVDTTESGSSLRITFSGSFTAEEQENLRSEIGEMIDRERGL